MNCHLTHKLSWKPLVEMYATSKDYRGTKHPSYLVHFWRGYGESLEYYKPPPAKFVGALRHFVRVLLQLLHEFRATDASTEEEMRRYDPATWNAYETREDFLPSYFPKLGYYESLLWGYLKLNLLLADPERMPGMMFTKSYVPMAVECMLSLDCEEKHPLYFSSHLAQAFVGDQLKPLTPDILTILRDHAAMMFRCMYSVTGTNRLLDEEFLTKLVFEFFTWTPPHD